MQINELLIGAASQLPQSSSPRLDVEVLLLQVLKVSRSYLYRCPEHELNVAEMQLYQQLLARRQAGEPMAYIVGQREFWSLPLMVSPATLIPRPETELLVELALTHIPKDGSCLVADLGTGSGAIALALASERANAVIYAIDNSWSALKVAQANAENLQFSNVCLLASDWLDAIQQNVFNMIVANPPYLAAADPHLICGDLRFEPHSALVAQAAGLAAFQKIIAQASKCLTVGGWLYLEHGYDQAEQVQSLLNQHGFSLVESHQDLAGIPRISCARLC